MAAAKKQLLIAVAAHSLAASCRAAGVLGPQGPVGSAERLILLNATGVMLVVVVPVIVLTLGFAWWYRSSNRRATYSPNWSYSGHLDLVACSIPTMVVILLSGVAWTRSHMLDAGRNLAGRIKPLHVEQFEPFDMNRPIERRFHRREQS